MNAINPNENNQDPTESVGQNTAPASADTSQSEIPQGEPENKSTGSIIAIIVIIAIIIIGGLYFWGQTVNDDTLKGIDAPAEEIVSVPDAITEALGQQGSSDTISDIDTDLSGTDFGDFDVELQEIDTLFNL